MRPTPPSWHKHHSTQHHITTSPHSTAQHRTDHLRAALSSRRRRRHRCSSYARIFSCVGTRLQSIRSVCGAKHTRCWSTKRCDAKCVMVMKSLDCWRFFYNCFYNQLFHNYNYAMPIEKQPNTTVRLSSPNNIPRAHLITTARSTSNPINGMCMSPVVDSASHKHAQHGSAVWR